MKDETRLALFHPSSFILHPFSQAVSFLLHFPGPSAGDPWGVGLGRWALPTTASCGARTFLPPAANGPPERPAARRATTARPTCGHLL